MSTNFTTSALHATRVVLLVSRESLQELNSNPSSRFVQRTNAKNLTFYFGTSWPGTLAAEPAAADAATAGADAAGADAGAVTAV
ncbi:hypothetical protein, partial [Burkholderia cenocepacia]|uniref:hypothetical protein n=1 Tax=Burkholderia cenocepacia TaxID=95486 RepID=UPI001C4E2D08